MGEIEKVLKRAQERKSTRGSDRDGRDKKKRG
jgi:hypothetical protein